MEGKPIIVVDSHGKKHHGLITRYHSAGLSREDFKAKYGGEPCINCVFVSDDPNRVDGHGQQIERFSSFVHRSSQAANGIIQAANGMYYLFPEEA